MIALKKKEKEKSTIAVAGAAAVLGLCGTAGTIDVRL